MSQAIAIPLTPKALRRVVQALRQALMTSHLEADRAYLRKLIDCLEDV